MQIAWTCTVLKYTYKIVIIDKEDYLKTSYEYFLRFEKDTIYICHMNPKNVRICHTILWNMSGTEIWFVYICIVWIYCKLITDLIEWTRAWLLFPDQCRAVIHNQIRNTTWKSIFIYHILITLNLFKLFDCNCILSL